MARERIELRICRSLKSITSHKMNSALVFSLLYTRPRNKDQVDIFYAHVLKATCFQAKLDHLNILRYIFASGWLILPIFSFPTNLPQAIFQKY